MTESGELVAVGASDEATEPAARDVLEEDPLDGILAAEAEDLIALRLDEFLGHGPKNSRRELGVTVVHGVFPRLNP